MSEHVEEAVCRERQRIQAERFARDRERLEKGEQKIDTIEKAVVYLTEQSRHQDRELADHETRLDAIEHRPGAFIDKVVTALVSAGIAAAITVVVNLLF